MSLQSCVCQTHGRMSLLHCSTGITFASCVSASSSSSSSSSSSGSSSSFTVAVAPISPLSLKRANLIVPKPSFGHCFCPPTASEKRSTFIVKASESTPDGEDAQSESDGEEFLEQDSLLDAKLLSKLEKKMKMKVAKNIRLRSKKLVHKRRLRKKGRWPPSKMKKLSNV